jgi:hypothetical protein
MIVCELAGQGLYGRIEYRLESYIVRVYRQSEIDSATEDEGFPRPIYVMSFGNGIAAEDRLIELLERPAWTLLKYS